MLSWDCRVLCFEKVGYSLNLEWVSNSALWVSNSALYYWLMMLKVLQSMKALTQRHTKITCYSPEWLGFCLICWCSFFGYLVIIGVLFATMEIANLRQVFFSSSWVEDVITKKNMLPCELLVNQVPGDGVNHSKNVHVYIMCI